MRPGLPTAMAIPINVSPDQAAMADLLSVLEQSLLTGSSVYSSSFISDSGASLSTLRRPYHGSDHRPEHLDHPRHHRHRDD